MARICIDYLLPSSLEKGEANGTQVTHGSAPLTKHWRNRFGGRLWRRHYDPAIEEYKTKYPLLDYAANHWKYHAQDGGIVDSELITQVGELCDIGDGSACTCSRVYSA
jgi:hypothetical protein